jgi:hypothetical protein
MITLKASIICGVFFHLDPLYFNFILNQQIWFDCSSIVPKKMQLCKLKIQKLKWKKIKIINNMYTVKYDKVNSKSIHSFHTTLIRVFVVIFFMD